MFWLNKKIFPQLSSWLVVWCLFAFVSLSQAAAWKTLTDCRLETAEYGDGDSFHIRSGSRDYIIRLYFVDCAETDSSFPDRVAEQAAYWKIDAAKTLKLGREAKQFTHKKLDAPFTVVTQFEDARGASNQRRYYGFVLPGGGTETLQEMLVANGLARIFGMTGKPPNGQDVEAYRQQLRRLENQAKSKKLGGWGTGQVNSNDDFFNRAKAASTSATPNPASNDSGKVDLNTATVEDLEALPKVGKVLAERMVEGRPFTSLEDLSRIQGVNAKVLEAITPLVVVRKR